MFKVIQETELPKLSQTSLFEKFNETSELGKNIVAELGKAKEKQIKADELAEILALMKLNGDAIIKNAIKAYEDGKIVILFNPETTNLPVSLPYMIKGSDSTAYIFADRFMNNVKNSNEYTSLMAVLEAAYLAQKLNDKPESFINNRPLMLNLSNLYTLMAISPLEQKLYLKGDNLTKAMLYVMSYFYRMIDGDEFTIIPGYKKIISDKIDEKVVKQIMEDVRSLPDTSFMSLIELIKQINPIRYKEIDQLYMNYFVSVCGVSLIFALENLGYLFLLVTSVAYKTGLTGYGINKMLSTNIRKTITLLATSGGV